MLYAKGHFAPVWRTNLRGFQNAGRETCEKAISVTHMGDDGGAEEVGKRVDGSKSYVYVIWCQKKTESQRQKAYLKNTG